MKILSTLLFLTLALPAAAQEIAGIVLDEKKDPLLSVTIKVYQGNKLKASGVTDIDGKYCAKPLEPGYYNVLMSHLGYDSTIVTDVIVSAGQRTTINFNSRPHDPKAPSTFRIIAYKKPIVDNDKPIRTYCPQRPELPTSSIIKDTIKITPVPPYKSDNNKRKGK